MKGSEIYAAYGTEEQHHAMWLVTLGLYETAYFKDWDFREGGSPNVRWLLRLLVER